MSEARLKVWFAASEAVPLAKSGGLADVIGALPKALARRGADVTVVLPKYGDIPQAWLEGEKTLHTFTVALGWRQQYCGIVEIEAAGIRFLLVDNEYYFKREQLYGYDDEAERFVFFSLAVVRLLQVSAARPDVLHCHDWQSGLIPMLLHARKQMDDNLRAIRTVYTIHNLQYQGVFARGLLQELLSSEAGTVSLDEMEFYGAGNCMKAGLQYADRLTTVSPTYAQEIQTEAWGEKLDGVIRARSGDLHGILNGIDTDVFDPMHDAQIAVPYRYSLVKKGKNKQALQEELGLDMQADAPLIGVVSRLVWQKGLDLLADVLDELLADGAQVVILGAGEPGLEYRLRETAARHPGRMAVWFGFNDGLARRIYAGSDMFAMPSRFEPCGLGQLIALRYCSVPIVRETGGLRDTVQSYNEHTGEGNGFSFAPAHAQDLLYTMRRAMDYYQDKSVWKQIVANGAKRTWGWDASAAAYEQLYLDLLS